MIELVSEEDEIKSTHHTIRLQPLYAPLHPTSTPRAFYPFPARGTDHRQGGTVCMSCVVPVAETSILERATELLELVKPKVTK